ncbi:MAG: crossover junction endodeoxyribonuclease RuvC [Sumerlaeia bacterium]
MNNQTNESNEHPRRILGIDPGLGSTGAAIIQQNGTKWRLIDSKVVTTASTTNITQRLFKIHQMVLAVIQQYHPDCVAVEGIFYAKNVKSTVQMAHGRGVALLAAAESNIPVHEISPLEIKQSVVGKGRASKEQVAQMVILQLGLPTAPKTDHESDAMACALAWAYREKHVLKVMQQITEDTNVTNKTLLSMRRTSKGRSRGWKT